MSKSLSLSTVAALVLALFSAPSAEGVDRETAVLESLNEIRRQAGAAAVRLDRDLSAACKKHSEYLALHKEEGVVKRWDTTLEEEGEDGYTVEGARAARFSLCTEYASLEVVGIFMTHPVHRQELLDPRLQRIGLGYHLEGGGSKHAVLDVGSGRGEGPWPKWAPNQPLVYPANGQKDVPCEFEAFDPDPIPEDADHKGGYPVTLLFQPGVKLSNTKLTMRETRDAGEIDAWISTPDSPLKCAESLNLAYLIAKEPLVPGAVYVVECTATVKDKALKWRTSFTTREEK